MKKIFKLIVFSIIGCCLFLCSSCNKEKEITLSIENYSDYIDFSESFVWGSGNTIGTFGYDELEAWVEANLNENYRVVEPIRISYNANCTYGVDTYYTSAHASTTEIVEINIGRHGAYSRTYVSLSKGKYFNTASRVTRRCEVTVLSISGKIELIE